MKLRKEKRKRNHSNLLHFLTLHSILKLEMTIFWVSQFSSKWDNPQANPVNINVHGDGSAHDTLVHVLGFLFRIILPDTWSLDDLSNSPRVIQTYVPIRGSRNADQKTFPHFLQIRFLEIFRAKFQGKLGINSKYSLTLITWDSIHKTSIMTHFPSTKLFSVNLPPCSDYETRKMTFLKPNLFYNRGN